MVTRGGLGRRFGPRKAAGSPGPPSLRSKPIDQGAPALRLAERGPRGALKPIGTDRGAEFASMARDPPFRSKRANPAFVPPERRAKNGYSRSFNAGCAAAGRPLNCSPPPHISRVLLPRVQLTGQDKISHRVMIAFTFPLCHYLWLEPALSERSER